jgi:drug/metabolite transporter (DMT)-like permease
MQERLVVSAAFILIAELLFASMGALIKHLTLSAVPLEIIVFFRNFLSLLFLLPWLNLSIFKTAHLPLHLSRGIIGILAMYCMFFAISALPLAQASLLMMTSPLFIPWISYLWQAQGIGIRMILSSIVGFFGVWLVLSPTDDSTLSWVTLVGLLAGFLAAIAQVNVSILARYDNTLKIIFYFSFIGSIASLPAAILHWQPLNIRIWLLFLCIGALAAVAQWLLTRAYALAKAGNIGVFTYSSVIFSGIYGYVFWEEKLSWPMLAGGVFIVLSGSIVLWRRRATRPACLT